ncbi:putative cytochrome b5 [Erysiphe necator]|uniref:Putative cytochrome b5 n=1 Tax=Uncinula necator TaxID=52586 RepID=A0A0B1P0X8_UNCNE|nr:putative cytochrome b5 [Erysiphe necator]KHJ31878.1 putative cytochrome b5 [Erysiphe necator]
MSKEFLYSEVSEHSAKEDLYMVIEDKVYDVTKFLDEHPGGEEVMLDVAGQDATEAFNDVGHSDEARKILTNLEIGELKESEKDSRPKPVPVSQSISLSSSSDGGIGLYAIIFLGGLAAFGAYKYLQKQEGAV